MLIRNLQYLVALEREHHFARAAQSCNATQPALSAGLKQLEEDLGFLLVERGQRFQGFTLEGQRVLQWAHRILAELSHLEQDASALRGRLEGRLRLGVVPTALPLMALITTPFAQAFPDVALSILSLTSAEIQRGLDDFSLDAGVTYLDNEPLARVRTVALYHERYFLFTPKSGPLVERARVTWAEAAQMPLCLLTPDMQNRRILDANFGAAGVAARAAITTNSVLTLVAHVRSGNWSCILPEAFRAVLGDDASLLMLPLEASGLQPAVGLVMPDREPLSPSARALHDTVESAGVRAAFRQAAGEIGSAGKALTLRIARKRSGLLPRSVYRVGL